MKATGNARQVILDMKIAQVIKAYSQLYGVTLNEAADLFYGSVTAEMIEEGTADLHCLGEQYLAEELWREMHENDK